MPLPVETFTSSVTLPVTARQAFAWHERPGTLEVLSPPWEHVRVVSATDGIRDGSRVTLHVDVGPVRTTWIMEHFGYEPGVAYNDRMLQGPFPFWEHRHAFIDNGDGTCQLTDTVRYSLPYGRLGRVFGGWFARRKLRKLFVWRHAVTRAALG